MIRLKARIRLKRIRKLRAETYRGLKLIEEEIDKWRNGDYG